MKKSKTGKSSSSTGREVNIDSAFIKINELLHKAQTYTECLLNHSRKTSKINTKRLSKRGDFVEEDIEEKAIASEARIHKDYLFSQPAILKNGTLREFQLTGLNWLISLYNNELNGILADEMGLGKTVQTIAFLGYLIEYKSLKGPFVIITPKSTVPNWMRELKKWLPDATSIFLSGIQEESVETEPLVRKKKFDILVMTYEGVKKHYVLLRRILWEYLVVDEGQKIKNEESLLSIVLRDFMVKKKLLLSGTPLQNNIHELWSLLNFLMPDLFDSSEVFDNWFSKTENKGLSNEEKEKMNHELLLKLHRVIKPFILRRVKSEVEKSLPPKKEIYIYVGLTELQKSMYQNMLKERAVMTGDCSKSVYLNMAMQLKKICNHPYLFENIEDDEKPLFGDHLITVCGKMMVLDKLLKKLSQEKHQVLIFSQMTSLLDIIEDYCSYRKYTYCRIDGNTTLDDREKQMAEFIEPNSPFFLFLLSTRAGGLGINLYTADTVILYDSDWNPQMDLQAMDRAHRIGQKNVVKVYRFITKGTVEERLNERQLIKLKWESLIVKGNHNQNKQFTKEDLKNMIDFGVSEIFQSEGGTYSDEDIELILKRGEEQANEKEKTLQEYLEKHKNLFDLGQEDCEHALYDFDGGNYREKRLKDIQTLNEITRKEKERMQESLNKSKRRFLSRKTEELEEEEYDSMSLEDILKIHSVRKKAELKFPQRHLYENIDRLIEIQIKQEAYFLYNRKNYISKEEMKFLTNEELEEKNKLIETGLMKWKKGEEYSLYRAFDLYDAKDYKHISEYIKTKTPEEVEQYVTKLLKHLENHPFKEKVENSIRKFTEKKDHKNKINKILKKIVGEREEYWSEIDEMDPELNKEMNAKFRKNKEKMLWPHEVSKYMIYFAEIHGYENVKEIRDSIIQEKRFRFDHVLRSRTVKDYESRIMKIIKYLEKLEGTEVEVEINSIKIPKPSKKPNSQKKIDEFLKSDIKAEVKSKLKREETPFEEQKELQASSKKTKT